MTTIILQSCIFFKCYLRIVSIAHSVIKMSVLVFLFLYILFFQL